MRCKYCSGETMLYRQINANGGKVVVERCAKCGRNPTKGKPFLPKITVADWESLPLLEDSTLYSEPCSVRGCGRMDTELHHFAPRHLFDNADDYPSAPLCRFHHDEWHKLTQTGSYFTRRAK